MLTINLHENIPTFDDGGRSLRDSFLHTLGPISHLEELLAAEAREQQRARGPGGLLGDG